MKIVFFGTPAFAAPFLEALLTERDFDIIATVTQPDKPAGRGNQLHACPVKMLAEQKSIPVLQPKTLKSTEAVDLLKPLEADLFVVVAYGKIIPKAILDLPKQGCINVHPSLLPKYRGPSPMQWAIAEGDDQTGVCVMKLDEGMDTGPILACETITINDNETYETLVDKVHAIGPRLLVETIKRLDAITPIVQDDGKATITRLLDREDGRIDWKAPMDVVERKFRAYRPWPGSWSIWKRGSEELRLKILDVAFADFNADVPPGTVTIKNNRLFVDCADGTLEILRLQPEGKAEMDAANFLRGYSDVSAAVLA